MHRIAVRILVLVLTFFLGMFAFALSHRSKLRDCVIEFSEKTHAEVVEDEIARTVFRYHIREFLSDVESPIYFLSNKNDSDPTEDVLMSLQGEGLNVRRLSQLGMSRGFNSLECYYCPHGSSEFILRLGRIRWLSESEILVGGSCRRWSLNADRAYLYHLVYKGNRWVVKDFELL